MHNSAIRKILQTFGRFSVSFHIANKNLNTVYYLATLDTAQSFVVVQNRGGGVGGGGGSAEGHAINKKLFHHLQKSFGLREVPTTSVNSDSGNMP
jgi:hypothetical protein